MRNLIAKFKLPVMAALVATSAHAQVTMTLYDATTYAEAGFTTSLKGTQILPVDGLIGIYAFNISPGADPNISTPFYTTCLSPDGVLDWATHTYTFETFAAASPGLNPSAWASSLPNGQGQLWGIQNANYLFSTLSGQIRGGGISGEEGTLQDQGAAMALAMYAALYNSTGYGGDVSTGPFAITSGMTDKVSYDYNQDISDLSKATITPVDGYVLVPPNTPGAGQDMILLATGIPQGSPVPEPATILAGALTLLPFGASTLRILRRNRAA